MHHKRKRPKARRAASALMKPHKDNAFKGTNGVRTRQDIRAALRMKDGTP